jgi:ATP-dependent Clp protease ATP-binding subunit ClpX
MEGAELEFDTRALREIALEARERDTGALGLRSIVEEIMLDIQFDLPDIENKSRYTVTDAVVRGEKPLFDKPAPADKKSP